MRLDEVEWNKPTTRAKIGGRIKRAVAQTEGLTLRKLAEEVLHCAPTIIYQYVSGVRAVRAEHLEQIAARTNHSLEWFLQDVDVSEQPEPPAHGSDVELSLLRRDFYHWKEIVDALDLPFADPHAALTRRMAYLERLVGIARVAAEADPRFRKEYAAALLRLGRAHTEQFEFRDALPPLEEAEALFVEIAENEENALDKARALQDRDSARQTLGAANEGLGQSDRAIDYFTEVERSSPPTLQWLGRLGLCAVYIRRLNLEEACRTWQAAMESLSAPEAASFFAHARPYLLGYLAGIVEMAGDYHRAVEWRRPALRNPPSEGRADFLLEGLLEQGEALQRCGRYSEARIPLETARLLALAIREHRYESRALAQQAMLAAALGNGEEARACAIQATASAGRSGNPVAQLQAVLANAEVCQLEAQTEQALLLAEQAVTLSQTVPAPRSRIAASTLHARLLVASAHAGGRSTEEACCAVTELLYLADASAWNWAQIQARLLYAEVLRQHGQKAQSEVVAEEAAEKMKKSLSSLLNRLAATPGWERLGLPIVPVESRTSPLSFDDPSVRLGFLGLQSRLTGQVDREAVRSVAEDIARQLHPEDARVFRESGWSQWMRSAGLMEAIHY